MLEFENVYDLPPALFLKWLSQRYNSVHFENSNEALFKTVEHLFSDYKEQWKIITFLVHTCGADPAAIFTNNSGFLTSTLHEALERHIHPMSFVILAAYVTMPFSSIRDYLNRTPLHLSIEHALHRYAFNTLTRSTHVPSSDLKQKHDLNTLVRAVDSSNRTALHYACEKLDEKSIYMIILAKKSAAADLMAMQDANGNTPFHTALLSFASTPSLSGSSLASIFKFMLKQNPEAIAFALNAQKQNFLHVAASTSRSGDILEN